MSRSSSILLCVFLLLGIGIGIVTATVTEPKTENNKDEFGTSSIRLWWRRPPLWWWRRHHAPFIGWWWRPHPKNPSPPTTHTAPSPSPIHNAASPTHTAPSPSPVHNASSPTHAAPSPSPVHNEASPTHTAPSPSPSPVHNAASPTHTAPSPSPVHNAASPTHETPSPVHHVISPPAPSLAPAAPTCVKMDDCLSDLIRSVFKHKISLSKQCCKVISTISDDCFYRGFSHSKRVPFFLSKVRNYCSHHQRSRTSAYMMKGDYFSKIKS